MAQIRNRRFLIINVLFYILLDHIAQGKFDIQFWSFQSLSMCYIAEETTIIIFSKKSDLSNEL